jgi:hypothetical protein
MRNPVLIYLAKAAVIKLSLVLKFAMLKAGCEMS